MAQYYVNDHEQPNGDHEVHNDNCPYLSKIVSKTPLGEHASCHTAVAVAKQIYPTADGCATCSPECHTS